MRQSYEFECAWYGNLAMRIKDRADWKLYVCDYFWVLDIDDHYEFYFHPRHFLGKAEKKQIPCSVIDYIQIKCKCFTDEDRKSKDWNSFNHSVLSRSPYNVESLADQLKVGNWFYGQGVHYFTMNGRFFMDDTYSGMQECSIMDIDWCMVDDMLRMHPATRSHYYIRSLLELHCFHGIVPGSIPVKPLQETSWNSKVWMQKYKDTTERIVKYTKYAQEERTQLRFMRKEVFQHTVYIVQEGFYYTESGKKVRLPDSSQMADRSVLYFQEIHLNQNPICRKTEICVENIDCLLAAKALRKEGYHPAVLNMANRQNPGGGVYNGAGAQEENLFRRTNLHMSLYQFAPYARQYGLHPSHTQYPMDWNYGGAYSPDVTVFRGEEPYGYPLLENPYSVDIISVAAMNHPELDQHGMIASHLVDGVKNKIRTILNIGLLHGHDSLVLSAFGCGAFRNPPAHMARLFHEVINQEYPDQFAKICFAVLEDHNSVRTDNPEGNYLPFYKEFMD